MTWSPWFELLPGTPAVHVVITRFSLGQGGMTALVSARLALFSSICLPAILAQRGQATFAWIVYVDTTLSPSALLHLRGLVQGIPNIAIQLINTSEVTEQDRRGDAYRMPPQLQLERVRRWSWLAPRAAATPVYMTTRLDADDALPVNAMYLIQQHARQAFYNLSSAVSRIFTCWAGFVSWYPDAEVPLGLFLAEPAADPRRASSSRCCSIGVTLITNDSSAPSSYSITHSKVGNELTSFLDGVVGSEAGWFALPVRPRTVTSDSMGGVVASAHATGTGETNNSRWLRRAIQTNSVDAVLQATHSGFDVGTLAQCNRVLVAEEADVLHSRRTEQPASCLDGFACSNNVERVLNSRSTQQHSPSQ